MNVLFTYQENQILRKENAALKQQILDLQRKLEENNVHVQDVRLDCDNPAREKAAPDEHASLRRKAGKR